MVKWILCSEQLPPLDTLVLIKTKKGEVTIGYRWQAYEEIEEDGVRYLAEFSWEYIPLPIFGSDFLTVWGDLPRVCQDDKIIEWMRMPE